MKWFMMSFIASGLLFAQTIKVAVAANVSYAMPKLIKEFRAKHPDVKVETILGSSGKLFAQIDNGAPFDLFLSANMKYPYKLYTKGIAKNKPKVYVKGSLALLSSQKRDFKYGLDILLQKSIQRVAIANPKTAPYGKAAIEAMKKRGIYSRILDKLIYAQSVSQATTYSIVAADIGFVAKSSLFSSKMKRYKEGINWVEVDSKLYKPIRQGIVLLRDNNSARAFYNYILGNNAKNILKEFGYQVDK